ncbi:hypothetical protein [Mesorhizobium sp.]|uniref:hypothetical protein n=1 Tax=Mesorhizobium sp. TaxID=1871066 RepID=UPI0025C01620|nr:hypothetical protein [Mesorhizobium sp.]
MSADDCGQAFAHSYVVVGNQYPDLGGWRLFGRNAHDVQTACEGNVMRRPYRFAGEL